MKKHLKVVLYNAAGHDEVLADPDVDFSKIKKDQLLWISGSRAEIEKLPYLPDDLKAAVTSDVRSVNLEIYDHCYRFFLPLSDRTAKSEPLVFIVGGVCVITLCEERAAFMDRFVETDRGESLNGKLTGSAFAAALISELLDDYRTATASIDHEIDKLEETILGKREFKAPLNTLATLRRLVSKLRSALGETSSTIHALTRPDFLAHIDSQDHAHFEGIARTVDRLDDAIARARETIIGSFELYTTRVAQETNQLVKALTIATVITGVIGCAAGVFGMNFDTPFFHSGLLGFLAVTISMMVASSVIVVIAIWRRWF